MTLTNPSLLWYRQLPDSSISVAVDGHFTELDPDEPVPGPRPVGRVVLTMPDYYADTLAHTLAALCEFADHLGAGQAGPTEWAIAQGLYAAARFMGCWCPPGRLQPTPD
jgi:hypothetical protein